VTRRVHTRFVKESVNRHVSDRKRWIKFGQERGNAPGPDPSTTTVGEIVSLKLSIGGPDAAAEKTTDAADDDDPQAALRQQLKDKKILCRICKGEHFTTKCPYKDTMKPLTDAPAENKSREESSSGGGAIGGKYVAPQLRAGGGDRKGESMRRDDQPTLRVTNLSEDTRDNDVYDLFKPFGTLARVFLSRDKETGRCKGFAFVSFHHKDEAERALLAIDGHGYDNLILRVEWAKTENKP
jgi:translation initiation factor 3 subunit G